MTVRGPVAVDALGVVLPHEHLICDGTPFLLQPATDEERAAAALTVSPATRDVVARYSCHVPHNLVLDDVERAIEEVARFRDRGGGTIVDVTSEGIRPAPEALRRIAEATDVHVVMGCGPYCEYTLTAELAARDTDEIEAAILRDVLEGIGGTDVRAGVIGEVGVNGQRRGDAWRSAVMTGCEERGLRAAARAALRTGLSLIVHQPNLVDAPAAIAAVLEEEGLAPERVCLGHMSSVLDLDLHARMVRRGYWIAYDNLGMNVENPFVEAANDERRVAWLLELLRRGCGDRLLLSHDVWSKLQLAHFGGNGYAHIHDVILPWLRREGVPEAELQRLCVHNPASFLAADLP
jgi:phosphotriesterase-related protein